MAEGDTLISGCYQVSTGEKAPEVILPGYQAQVERSGIQHSRLKLRNSAARLSETLGEIYRLQPSGSPPSTDEDGSSTIGGTDGTTIQTFHCRHEHETWAYRCRCNFQIVRTKPGAAYRYAMRSMGRPVLLGTKNSFPIATRRIQTAMNGLMEHLNHRSEIAADERKSDAEDDHGLGLGEDDMVGLNGHLTSCTFSSAWRDSPDADCVLTLHYDHPLDDGESSTSSWKRQAGLLCQKLRLRRLNGRSKGALLSVGGQETIQNSTDDCGNNDDNNNNDEEATIRDTVFLARSNFEDTDNQIDFSSIQGKWKVSLDSVVPSDATSNIAIPVYYDKPETAFYHPNPNAMTTALAWMLNRLESISSSSLTSSMVQEAKNHPKLNLLEMYCGCGAHTVALGRSGLVSNILAIELDPRLVRACQTNVDKNSLQNLVEVRRGDAGRWAKEESRKRRNRNRTNSAVGNEADGGETNRNESCYDLLLVDPPRQGLDEEVCRMAMMGMDGEVGGGMSKGLFRNILYVSCGHRALLRDLKRLSTAYEVVNCAQMDLFPRTDSIETLVHLRRRSS